MFHRSIILSANLHINTVWHLVCVHLTISVYCRQHTPIVCVQNCRRPTLDYEKKPSSVFIFAYVYFIWLFLWIWNCVLNASLHTVSLALVCFWWWTGKCTIMESHGRVRARFSECSPLFLTISASLSSSLPFPLFHPSPLKFWDSRSFCCCLFRLLLSSRLTRVSLAPSPPPPLLPRCVSCIVNSSQKRDKVSARVPPASLSVLPAICYCLLR